LVEKIYYLMDQTTKTIFVFDENKCVGCNACSVACMNENEVDPAIPWRNVYLAPVEKPDLPLFYLSMSCNHCEDAPCMKGCPALAYSRDDITGAVLHHADKCIGCQYCTWTCPFDAPKYNPDKGIVEKCTFCNHRLLEGRQPACAELCPVGALEVEQTTFSREESLASSPVPVDVGSKIKIIPLEAGKMPLMDLSLFEDLEPAEITFPATKISARKEWPLLVFTLLVAAMFGIYASGITRDFNLMQKAIFLGFGLTAAIFSTIHLGKKFRAWRAILNIRGSWLSREILFFGLFMTTLFVDLLIVDLIDWIAIFFGTGLLVSIDMLYQAATWRWKTKFHSAQVIWIALSVFCLLKTWLVVFGVIGFLRILLYFYRKGIAVRQLLEWLRISSLGAAIVFAFYGSFWGSIILFGMGELLDRIEFYNELKVSHPQEELALKNKI
jgi:Fe-S-cluster-containing dehydrogenase component